MVSFRMGKQYDVHFLIKREHLYKLQITGKTNKTKKDKEDSLLSKKPHSSWERKVIKEQPQPNNTWSIPCRWRWWRRGSGDMWFMVVYGGEEGARVVGVSATQK